MRNALSARAGLFLTAALFLANTCPLLSQDSPASSLASSPLAASACPKYRGDLHNTGRGPGRPMQAVQQWSFPTQPAPFSSAVYDGDGMLFLGSDALHALDAQTGVQKWEFHAGSSARLGNATPVLGANGLIYITSQQGVHAVSKRTGKAVWNYSADNAGDVTCAVGKDGTVYAYVGIIFVALDGRTGAEKWKTSAPNPYTNIGYIPPSPTLGAQRTVIFGGKDHKVYALDCATGKSRWARDMQQSFFMSSPAVGDDGAIYIGGVDGKKGTMNALDGVTGRILWQTNCPSPLMTSPALGDNGLLYFGNGDHNVYALDQKTGAVRWKFATGNWVEASPAIGVDGTVYIGSCDHKLYALDGATGAKKWEFEAEDSLFASPLITPDGALFYSTYNGAYHALPRSKQDQLAKEQAASNPDTQVPPG